MKNYAKVILKSSKERSILRFHPWIFSGAIKSIEGKPEEGDIVEIYDNNNNFLAIGHYQIGSITVRIFCFTNEDIDKNFWIKKFKTALESRKRIGLWNNHETNVFRLIHGEGDGFPGFICDYYDGNLVFQFHSVGMYKHKELFVEILTELLGQSIISIYDKSEGAIPYKAKTDQRNGFLYGKQEQVIVKEYGNRYKIDFIEGQKTGFFIDQRENRKLLEKYSNQANVLNMFSYTGGFSVAALKGNAKLVHSVDSSEKAINLTEENIKINFPDQNHESFAKDAFNYLDHMESGFYDVIVLDPPAFAKHLNALKQALRGYQRINKVAIEKIKQGGIIFTFSCSQVVSKDDFRKAVFESAASTGRQVKILHQLNQPADHPVNIYHPESEYLKGLVLMVF